jgi:hypothetical protein
MPSAAEAMLASPAPTAAAAAVSPADSDVVMADAADTTMTGGSADAAPSTAATVAVAPPSPAAAGTAMAVSPPPQPAPAKRHRLFLDETMPSFFRRMAWSPDGALLLTPAGMLPPTSEAGSSASSVPVPTTHAFCRDAWARCEAHLVHSGAHWCLSARVVAMCL